MGNGGMREGMGEWGRMVNGGMKEGKEGTMGDYENGRMRWRI